MLFFYLAAWYSLANGVIAILDHNTTSKATCRTIRQDPSWPSQYAWDSFNQTLGGKLIATIPIAAPCHTTLFGKPNPLFDEEQCSSLRNTWFLPETHAPSSSSPMAYAFTNNSCNPWLQPESPCTLGSHVVYSVNATESSDFQHAIQFATEHNIRLAVRNTGHDYLGKSTGAHALAIWTHHIKSMELLQYDGADYKGPAVKVGAGVEVLDAYEFASSHGLVVVGGNCPTVGLTGGYIQGGGHGPLASRFGLAADQALEYEVVTPTGDLLLATASQNSDLFWALRGGGGGTFGVVFSVTVKAYPDTYVSIANMTVADNGTNTDAIYSGIGYFIQNVLPDLVDTNAFVSWVAAPTGFLIAPAILPDVKSDELTQIMQPLFDKFDDLGLIYQYNISQHPTFLSAYQYYQASSSWNVSDYNTGGRLIPRDLAIQNTSALVEAIRYIGTSTILSGVGFNVSRGVSSPDDVAANPYLRRALFDIVIGTPINYTDWSVTLRDQDEITYDLLPPLEKLTPDGGVYLNEADFRQPDWQRTMYRDHYERLLDIKHKYDPEGVLYAKTAVGSEEWVEQSDGRLCRVG
ncbi:FAD-binding domain-containing protein [Hypoxylon sp. FL1284]|nr:FAD-binding domain-containing protein [Hypoxylon sp. FL1284]